MAKEILGDPADLRLVVGFLRLLRKWSQEELSKASGVDRGMISDYELGIKSPTRKALRRLASGVGLPYRFVEILLPFCRAARLSLHGTEGSPEAEAAEGLASGLDGAILDAVLPHLAPHLMELEALMGEEEKIPVAKDRLAAAGLWEVLKKLSPGRRRLTVERERRFWNWALAERLSEESARAAAHRADKAVELARLARRVAELTTGSEDLRSGLLGWVWAFEANALRVQGDLAGAEEGFLRSDHLLAVGESADPGLLDATRPLDLKASLRRYQGRFAEALNLLDQALKANGSKETQGRILINKANTLRLMGDRGRALAELRQAERLLEGSQDARLVLVVKHCLAQSLWQLGRHAEAEARLPEVRKKAVAIGNELDLIRVLWVEGGVAAGLGRREQAFAALEKVRRYFNDQRIAYDAALASLELAVLYLEEERTAEVKKLADEMFWIFKAQGVHKEAVAALLLFFEAATREEATSEQARRLADYLKKARCTPGLRFESQS
jgi:transcriptional regulator with XRE-family HTH domain